MTKSRTNRRRRLNRARDYQRWLENTLHFQQTTLERTHRQLQFRVAELEAIWRGMGGPKILLVPKIIEERDPGTGDLVRELVVRRLHWDGFGLSKAAESLHVRFSTDRHMKQLERDPEGFLEYRWRNAGSAIGVELVQWLRERQAQGAAV